MSDGKAANTGLLRKFSPLEGMKKDNLVALARKISVKQLPANRFLFKQGDKERVTYWLVSGMLELREDDRTVAMIRGGTDEARNPLSTMPSRVYDQKQTKGRT